ncbi:MAG: response regulator transcription factor [Bacteroidota bacterium]
MSPNSPPRVLIVEDEVLLRVEIQKTLETLGYQIAGVTGNGDQALDLLANHQPDIALLDIHIDGTRNGVDLARLIRRRYTFPFVFLTAFSDRATLEELKDTMPYGFIVKPFTEGDLRSSIELALHQHRTEQRSSLPPLPCLNRHLHTGLTPRDYEVLSLLDQGLSNTEVGQRLYVSLNTVKYYCKSIYGKLGAKNRLEALHVARQMR